MADANPPQLPDFLKSAKQQSSITADRGLLNQNVNKLATDLGSNNTDVVAALDAIAAAINALPSN